MYQYPVSLVVCTEKSLAYHLMIAMDMYISCMSLGWSNAPSLGLLQWRHNEHDGVSNHQPQDCLVNRLFKRRSKKTPKLRVTGLCTGNSPVTGEFPAQRASNVENVFIWWRDHAESFWFPANSHFCELATRGTSTNQIAASWMLQATWLATVASRHIVWQALLISL